MTSLLSQFKDDKEMMDILTNENDLKDVLLLLQVTADEYMEETREKLNDPRKSVQQKAKEALEIAEAIIEAEKEIRELELYNTIKLRERDLRHITDV